MSDHDELCEIAPPGFYACRCSERSNPVGDEVCGWCGATLTSAGTCPEETCPEDTSMSEGGAQ